MGSSENAEGQASLGSQAGRSGSGPFSESGSVGLGGGGAAGASSSPLVSVVIPAYNAHSYIGRALNSVLAQSYSNFEILVVNDGSPDTELLERVLQPFLSKIRYIKQENQGPSGARNRAIREARGRYVAFLDSDDTWFPHHLMTQVALLMRDPLLHLVYSDSILIRGDKLLGNSFASEPQHPPVSFEKLLTEECTVMTSSTVASREAMMTAGLFDENFLRCEDFDLWLRMAFRGSRMDYCTQPGIHHYLTEDSLASDSYLLKRARIGVYEKIARSLPLTPSQKNLVHSLIDTTEARCQKELLKQYLRSGDYEKALGAAARASELAPHDRKLWITVFGLRRMPAVFRRVHGIHEKFLGVRTKLRATQSRRSLDVSTANSGK